MKKVIALMLAVMMLAAFAGCSGGEKWPTEGLGAMLPAPTSGTVKNIHTFDDSFSADVENPSADEFDKYVSACKDVGFTLEADTSSGYEAFNEEGYKLEISDSSKRLSIDLYTPKGTGTLRWPASDLGKLVPKPSSEKGNVKWEHDDSFLIYVSGVSLDQFNDYADTCADAGFNIDYDRGDKYYRAYNKDGCYLSVEYEGFNVISIKAEEKSESESDEETEKTKETEKAKPTEKPTEKPAEKKPAESGEVTASFKEMMDEYESFMDSYVEFMQKYKNSDDVSGMLGDYSKMMSDYSSYMTKINAVDKSSLSAADAAYYLEVTSRVTKKLATVAE